MVGLQQTILFVDDDEHFLSYLAESMQNAGYRVLTETNGTAALSLLDAGAAVDLVVTDYSMPEMNGLELIAAMRERTLSIPIILLTAHGNVDTYFTAMYMGAYEVTSKPISIGTLEAIVKEALYSSARGKKSAPGASETATDA